MSEGASETRLESLWAGDFGNAYVERNAEAERGRRAFWETIVGATGPDDVLEVGANVGGNLHWIAELAPSARVAGVDVNADALQRLHERLPGVDARLASGRKLPWDDGAFDLVFTMGVLIHQSSEELEQMMSEIIRCSRRWVLCGEYFAEQEEEVPYRGESGALFRRDYGAIYQRLNPELRLAERGFLARGPDSSWDDVTWWLFESPVA